MVSLSLSSTNDYGYFHVFNRGVAKQPLFHDAQDDRHFLETLSYYLDDNVSKRLSFLTEEEREQVLVDPPKQPLVEILAYCLMTNHFHLVVHVLQEGGLSTFMRRAMNSYTRAFNTRYTRVGTAFQGKFRSVAIETNEHLLHVTRYVHLNPYVARLVETPSKYQWSSYPAYLAATSSRLVNPSLVLALAHGNANYQEFVEDYASYARDLEYIKHIVKIAEGR